jgi:archaellum biogenesis protein FlaJ (TadC family)
MSLFQIKRNVTKMGLVSYIKKVFRTNRGQFLRKMAVLLYAIHAIMTGQKVNVPQISTKFGNIFANFSTKKHAENIGANHGAG